MPIEKLRGQFIKDSKPKEKKMRNDTVCYGNNVSAFGMYKQSGWVRTKKGAFTYGY